MNAKYLLVSASLISAFAWGSLPPNSKIIAVSAFGKIKIGDSIAAHCKKISAETDTLQTTKRHARFYLYLFSSGLPKRCINLQCGPFARQILAEGGFVIGGTDRDFENEVGLSEADLRNAGSLTVVTDSDRKVQAIYKDVSNWDIPQVLAKIR